MRLSRTGRFLTMVICLGAIVAVTGVALVTYSEGNLFWLGGPQAAGCGTPPSVGGNTPLGTSMAFSRPTEGSNGVNHWYNFTVVASGGAFNWADLRLEVITATGANVTPSAGWTGGVLGAMGGAVAVYDFTSGTWTSGGDTPVLGSQTFTIDSATTDLSAVGDSLYVAGVGCFHGSISVAIP